MRKILSIILFLLLCFFALSVTQVNSAGCDGPCYDNGDCLDDPVCPYCDFTGGGIQGKCKPFPTPTPTPQPTATPPPAGCIPCNGNCIGGQSCCSPCVKDENPIQGTCVCREPTPTPQPTPTYGLLPTPPPGSGCIPFDFTGMGCYSQYPYFCTDNATYWWCCVDQSSCEQVAPAEPTPPTPWGGGPIETAIGPIDPRNLQGFIQTLLNLAFGVAGGIAFLLMLFGAFQVMTSAGNPEKMKAGSELITSALAGLLFIVFSIFILKLIGISILDIPGFGR